MPLSDFILKARVNMALIRDPRVGSLDVGVGAHNGRITLTGDVDTEEERRAAEEAARSVEGVSAVDNELTFGEGQRADTAELVCQRFLRKLEEEWNALPNQSAMAQADYLRWALWMVAKFRIPEEVAGDSTAETVADVTEQALTRIAGYVGAPKALIAMEMMEQAELIAASPTLDAPESEGSTLVSTPAVGGNPSRSAA